MDIFSVSDANAPRLENEVGKLSSGVATSPMTISEFLEEVVLKGRVSLNMRPWITADLLQRDKHLNLYEAVDEESSLTGKATDELLREKLGAYFAKRTRFDSMFEHGKTFKYGALNVGGAGATHYGIFCLILQQSFPAPGEQVVYVKQDSLNGYTDDDGNLDVHSLQHDLACHSHRHYLAALKHATELGSRRHEWPQMLCSDADYVEVIFIAPLNAARIGEVRIPVTEYRKLWDLCFAAHGRKLTDAEKALAHDFRQILLAIRDKAITLSEVPDA